jgi:hypothetical protein
MNEILILCDERDKKQQSMLTNMVDSCHRRAVGSVCQWPRCMGACLR